MCGGGWGAELGPGLALVASSWLSLSRKMLLPDPSDLPSVKSPAPHHECTVLGHSRSCHQLTVLREAGPFLISLLELEMGLQCGFWSLPNLTGVGLQDLREPSAGPCSGPCPEHFRYIYISCKGKSLQNRVFCDLCCPCC